MQKAGCEELKDMVYRKYKNESAMAASLGWPRQRLNKITTGRRVPTVQEVGEISNALGENVGKIAGLFLSKKSPNGDECGLVQRKPTST